jgi:hypothetical protein
VATAAADCTLDAVADTKIRKHEPDGLTMKLMLEYFFGQAAAFFGQPMG